MDAEKTNQLFRERLRCRILEAEKEAETIRADKYHNIILGMLAREGGSYVTQPEASRVHRATRGPLASPMLPVDDVRCPDLYCGGVLILTQQSSGPAEALTIAQRRPSADPPVVGRKRGPSSAENPESARSSKRTRRFSNLPQCTALKPYDTRMSVPRDRFGVDVEGILEGAGLTPLLLTRAEAAHAEETPGIEWTTFVKLFGGTRNSEWPQCSKVPGYENFICTTTIAQPFMPLSPGKPGLFLRLPSIIEVPQSDRDETFHVLSATQPGDTMYYLGKYAIIPLPQIQFTWYNLSYTVRYD